MKSIYKFSVILSLFGCSLVSCTDEQNLSYTGPSVVEFKNYYYETQTRLGTRFPFKYPFVVAPENNSLSALTVRQLQAPALSRTDSLLVQLVGPQRNEDIVINYSIDETSSAAEGVHYSINGTKGQVNIRANTSSGYIYINNLAGLVAVEPTRVTLKLTLTGNEEIKPSENYKSFTYNITK